MNDSIENEESGALAAPAAAARALACIEELLSQSRQLNAGRLARELDMALWRGFEASESYVDEHEEEDVDVYVNELALKRRKAVEWALRELVAWKPSDAAALMRLQISLITLLASSDSTEAAIGAIPQNVTQLHFLESIEKMLQSIAFLESEAGIRSLHSKLDELGYEEICAAGRDADYQKLATRIRHLEVMASPDACFIVLLLAKHAPQRLANEIERRRDVIFSLFVKNQLRNESLKFSLDVNDITFKFVCAFQLNSMPVESAFENAVATLEEVLLQVANTESWCSWLAEFVRYPHGNTVADAAMGPALAKLTASHWAAYVDAVQLWTHVGTARAVANQLVSFYRVVGAEASKEMWRLAFNRWDGWDYDSLAEHSFLSAPSVCSFDFPVAMHYASIPLEDAKVIESKLTQDIETLEQKTWFSDMSALASHRNRCSSRLRLVRHGIAIGLAGETPIDALPNPIKPDSEFAEIRYRFFDVNRGRIL